jgi:hypothetical protein
MSFEATDDLTKRPEKDRRVYRCPAGRCVSVEPTFRCPHQTGARRAPEPAAALTAEVVSAVTQALAMRALGWRAAERRRAQDSEAAFGSVAYRLRHGRPW